MTHLILHIGHPKTGTTALQTTLAANADRLLKAGVLYPTKATPMPQAHKHALARPYLTGTAGGELMRLTGLQGDALMQLADQYWQSLTAEIRANPHETLILSCESFWSVPLRRSFPERLAEVADRVTVVAYLRSPARRFLSQINQKVRMFVGIQLPPAEYYRPIIEAYRDVGLPPMSLNVFASPQLIKGDIVADFCGKYLPDDLPELARGETERGNESVSNEALAILDELPGKYATQLRKDSSRRSRAVALLRRADGEVGGNQRPSFKPGIAEAMIARSTDLPWLRDEAGIRFDDVDYDLVGTTGHVDVAGLRRVEDFCPVDPDRLAELRARTGRKLARIFGVSPVRYHIGRLLGSAVP